MEETKSRLKLSELFLFIILPILLVEISLVLRGTIFTAHWYFLVNFAISFSIIVFVIGFQKYKKSKFLLFALVFQIPILLLNSAGMLDEPNWNNSTTSWIQDKVGNDLLARGTIGIISGLVGVYVFLLISKIKLSEENGKILEHNFANYRTVVGLTAFISGIIPVGLFVTDAPLIVAWTLRSSLLLSGFVVGGFAISLGMLFGHSKSAMLIFIGSILSFVLSFFLSLLLIPFASGPTDLVFVSQMAFFMNTLLLTGTVAYMMNFNNHVYSKLIKKFLN